MAFSISFYPEAELELAEAVGWYEEQQRGLGFKFYEDYLAVRNLLLTTPAHSRSSLAMPVAQFPYTVFFLIEDDIVVVYAVFHQKRNPKSWMSRLE